MKKADSIAGVGSVNSHQANLKSSYNIGERLLFSIVWIVVFMTPMLNFFMRPFDGLDPVELMLGWFKIIPFFVIYIINTTVFVPVFALKRHYIAYVFSTLLFIIAFFWVVKYAESDHLSQLSVVNSEGVIVGRSGLFTYINFHWNVLLAVAMCTAYFAIKMVYISIRDEQAMESLRRRNAEAEMEQLRHQINPHFIMNTLNNIHALVDINSEQAKSAIIELSKMFRHLIYESRGQLIKLVDDLSFIDNYLCLMRLRYYDNVEINIKQPAAIEQNIYIAPLALVIFVENAFKHGVSGNLPSYINIELKIEQGRILYRVENSLHSTKGAGDGIGLENLRKRLDHIYGKNYSLSVAEGAESYVVQFNIPILHEA